VTAAMVVLVLVCVCVCFGLLGEADTSRGKKGGAVAIIWAELSWVLGMRAGQYRKLSPPAILTCGPCSAPSNC
jgi:hypothetical protein